MSEELKACPFCESEVRIWIDRPGSHKNWITCDKCGETHLLSEWNTRPL
jgi:RNA polymerase subunit RPABC4/transcription elongation factor Spt4